MAKIDWLEGSGGGGGKSGKGGSQEAPNTLRSNSVAHIVDLLGEGEIVGLVNGEQSIYFSDTPLLSNDGTHNYLGVSWSFRPGLPDQDYLPGFGNVSSEDVISVDVRKHAPYTYVVTNPYADAIQVTVRLPALFEQDDQGALNPSSVDFVLEVRYANGPWVNPFNSSLNISGKCMSSYDRTYTFDLPKNPNTGVPSYPWDLRMTRLSNNQDDQNDNGIPDGQEDLSSTVQNACTLYSVATLLYDKLSYPNSSVIGIVVDASLFGANLPARSYEVYGKIIQVPTNYDPVNRTYSGIWDGTFKWVYSNNAAWVFYDVLDNVRYGLGEYLADLYIDKWTLYSIGQYCDESVPDGYGGFEPRITFNGVISTQKDAFEFLQLMASAFRGMAYWASGAVTASQDRPEDPVMLVTKANVVKGQFEYKSTALKARHTVVTVTWNDPQDLYKTATEVIEDPDGIDRYGYRPKDVVAIGCTSRGQAHRLGKWMLASELRETQTVTYTAGLDHGFIRPGDIVSIQDPDIAGVQTGGRLLAGSTTSVLLLDRPVNLEQGNTYTVSAMMPDGSVGSAPVNILAYGDTTTLTLPAPLPQQPLAGAIWVMASNNLVPASYRIVGIRETDEHQFEIIGIQHDATKFALVDYDIQLAEPVTSSLPTGPLGLPSNVTVVEQLYKSNNQIKNQVVVSWSVPQDPRIASYVVERQAVAGGSWVTLGQTDQNSVDDEDSPSGTFNFRVTAIAYNGLRSVAVTEQQIYGKTKPPSFVTNFNYEAATDGVNLYWDQVTDLDVVGYEIREGHDWATGTVLTTQHISTSYFIALLDGVFHTYWIKAIDDSGNYSLSATGLSAKVKTPDDVTTFVAQPQGDYVLFKWTPVEGAGIEYEIRQGQYWQTGIFVSRSAGDNNLVLYPGNGDAAFWLKPLSKAGLYANDAILCRAILTPTVERDQVLYYDAQDAGWPGLKRRLVANPLKDNELEITIPALNGAISGSYYEQIDLGTTYQARNMVYPIIGTTSQGGTDTGPTWDDDTFTWLDPQAQAVWFPDADVAGYEFVPKLAAHTGLVIENSDLDGVLFNGTLPTLSGANPIVQPVSPTFRDAVWMPGLDVSGTNYAEYPIAVGTIFSYACRMRLKSAPTVHMVFFTLRASDGSAWLRCGYDDTTTTLYLQDKSGQRMDVAMPAWALAEEGIGIAVSQSSTQRIFIATSGLGDVQQTIAPYAANAVAFNRVSLYAA